MMRIIGYLSAQRISLRQVSSSGDHRIGCTHTYLTQEGDEMIDRQNGDAFNFFILLFNLIIVLKL